MPRESALVYKDEILTTLAAGGNVARFVSFAPDGTIRHACPPLPDGIGLEGAVAAVLADAAAGTVNVRTYRPEAPESNPFVFGIADPATAVATVREHLAAGLHVIVNETIPLGDGGIGGGVIQDGIVELVPDATPRGVEDGDPATLPLNVAAALLRTIYGVDITHLAVPGMRTEFSLHPYRCGTRGEPLIVWERRPVAPAPATRVTPSWPNAVSRFLGDKAYGLLMASIYGASVPRTTVIARTVAPFTFGQPTGEPRRWSRAVPAVKLPGELPTFNRWVDPFQVAADCGDQLATILSQDDVPAEYAGAAMTDSNGTTIEGAHGYGDDFMLGLKAAAPLPAAVHDAVAAAVARLAAAFGPVTCEWVYAAGRVWIVQVNQVHTAQAHPGDVTWLDFDATDGLEALRTMVSELELGHGIVVHGNVGVTSHIGDVLRRACVPHLFQRTVEQAAA